MATCGKGEESRIIEDYKLQIVYRPKQVKETHGQESERLGFRGRKEGCRPVSPM